MKTLTDCVNQLKTNLQAIAGSVMTQSYKGLEVSLFETNDSEQARLFAESLQHRDDEMSGCSFNNPYSKQALQAVWNLADILSIALTYMPCESGFGIVRGFMSTGLNNKLNINCLCDSMDYIDSKGMLPTPYVVDDITYRINLELIDFITEVRETKNGSALFQTLNQLCQTMLFQTFSIDEEILITAKKRTDDYAQYINKLYQPDDERDSYHTCDEYDLDEKEFVFYDAVSDEAKNECLMPIITTLLTEKAEFTTPFDKKDNTGYLLVKALVIILGAVLAMIAGAAIGFLIGGLPGAVIGAGVGGLVAGLSFTLWNTKNHFLCDATTISDRYLGRATDVSKSQLQPTV